LVFLSEVLLFSFQTEIGLAWFEVGMWIFILAKPIAWGRKMRGGWWLLIGQHLFATGFNLVAGAYIFLIRAIIEIGLAIYGLKKWKKLK